MNTLFRLLRKIGIQCKRNKAKMKLLIIRNRSSNKGEKGYDDKTLLYNNLFIYY